MQNYNVVTITNRYANKRKQRNGVDCARGKLLRESLNWVANSSMITRLTGDRTDSQLGTDFFFTTIKISDGKKKWNENVMFQISLTSFYSVGISYVVIKSSCLGTDSHFPLSYKMQTRKLVDILP